MSYEVIKDNIVSLQKPVQAIVNSSNPFMSMGGGVCGAIHKVAGFEFTKYCIKLGGLTPTQCKITPGFDLPYEYVIHTLAPIYKKTYNPEKNLINTYENIIKLAKEYSIKSVAFPILGAGHYGYPLEIAINCAIQVFERYNFIDIKLVCYNDFEYSTAKQIIKRPQLWSFYFFFF